MFLHFSEIECIWELYKLSIWKLPIFFLDDPGLSCGKRKPGLTTYQKEVLRYAVAGDEVQMSTAGNTIEATIKIVDPFKHELTVGLSGDQEMVIHITDVVEGMFL